ncbi:hypothetical protein SCLARK_00433 [Spiroplasma clarkii]|nr:hypothetical protein SCLARK_00433 [Spiroplasma clarkii]
MKSWRAKTSKQNSSKTFKNIYNPSYCKVIFETKTYLKNNRRNYDFEITSAGDFPYENGSAMYTDIWTKYDADLGEVVETKKDKAAKNGIVLNPNDKTPTVFVREVTIGTFKLVFSQTGDNITDQYSIVGTSNIDLKDYAEYQINYSLKEWEKISSSAKGVTKFLEKYEKVIFGV